MKDWTPTRADVLEVARQVDEARGSPGSVEAVERMFAARDRTGAEHLRRTGAPDEGAFCRKMFVQLAGCRDSWAAAEPGAGPRMEGMLRAAVRDAEMRGRT